MDFIFEYKNSFSDSFCDDLVTYFENKKEFHEVNNKYEVGRVGRPYERIIDRTDTWLGCLRHQSYIDNFKPTIDTVIKDCVNDLARTFILPNKWRITGHKLQKSTSGGGFKSWHTEYHYDYTELSERFLVWSIYLNDVDSGFTDFKFQNKSVKSEKGTLVIWPAYFTHEHRASTELKSDKYILTGWTNYER